MVWGLNIEDKVEIEERELFCPPHCFPHKLPFTQPIINEPCHYHRKRWRMLHHIPYCKILKCSNYELMMKEYKKHRK